MCICTVVTGGYLVYRGLYTLNLDTWYACFASWVLYAAELWGAASMLLFFMQVWDPQELPAQRPLEDVDVDVFVPSYNEDVAILRGTLQACLAMDYPHRTYLLDDGKRDDVRQLCEELGVHYITRDNNLHAKAGNLNNALDQTDGEFVAILDADHVPEPHFLSHMIGHFRDPEVGFVQSPHAFSNFDTFQGQVNFEKGRFWDEGELFYKVIQPARNATNSVIFAGSAAIFRREALKEIGYIATETITEDMHTGIRMATRGWKSKYVNERLIAGQGASDVTSFHGQRLRWAEGNLSILAYDNPLTIKGLSIIQRLTYFASIIHWAGGIPRLAIYATPAMMLLTGVAPVKEFTPLLGAITVGYIAMMLLTLRKVFRGHMRYGLIEFFNMANFWTQIRATFRALLYRKRSKFVVTNKRGGRQGTTLPYVAPQIILLAFSVFALIYGWTRHLMFDAHLDAIGMGIATILVLHNAFFAVAYLRTAMTPVSKRLAYRHRINMPVKYNFVTDDGETIEGVGVTTDLNELGLSFVSYDSLPINETGSLKVMANGDSLETDGTVCYAAHTQGEGQEAHSLYRYGISFAGIAPEAIDASSRMIQRYAVAPWYSLFERETVQSNHPWFSSRRKNGRAPFKLAVRLEGPGGDVYSTTQDISTGAMRCLSASHVDPKLFTKAEIFSPMGSILVNTRASEIRNITGPPHNIREFVLNFESYEGQARSQLQSLLELTAEPQTRHELMGLHGSRRQPLLRPLAAAALILMILSPAAVGVFKHTYDDDLLLVKTTDEAAVDTALASAEGLNRILAEALSKEQTDLRRLILLKDALEREGRFEELVRVCRLIVAQRPRDPDMGKALVAALTDARRFDESATLSAAWRSALEAQGMTSHANTFEVLAARNLRKSGDEFGTLDAFRRIVAARPEDEKVRAEYLGIMLEAGLAHEALRQFTALPQDQSTRRQIMTIHSSLGDFRQAEGVARDLLRDIPTDVKLHIELANFLCWQEDFGAAVQIYRGLYQQEPDNLTVALGLGETLSWSGSGSAALAVFGKLIDDGEDSDRLNRGFLDAFLGTHNPTQSDKHRLPWMLKRHQMVSPLPADIAGRLATALAQADFTALAIELLEETLLSHPTDRDLRLRLADAMVAVGRNNDAHLLYRTLLAEEQIGQ
ncbi:MAG TPA: glycosyltransferase [Planctomycetes bacterium]|nr:glycosyltransferase [Planctomycetota bacterium]